MRPTGQHSGVVDLDVLETKGVFTKRPRFQDQHQQSNLQDNTVDWIYVEIYKSAKQSGFTFIILMLCVNILNSCLNCLAIKLNVCRWIASEWLVDQCILCI